MEGRKIIDYWDGQPVHRQMTPYERYLENAKRAGVEPVSEETLKLAITFLGHRNGTDVILKKKPL